MGRKKENLNAGVGKVKKPFYKKWWFWLLVILVIGGIGAAGGDGGSTQDAATQTSTSAETTEAKTYTADAESLKALFEDTFEFSYENLTVEQEEDGHWTISYYPTYAGTDEYFIQNNINWYIAYCKKAYQIDGVTNVEFDASTLFNDGKGNDFVDNAMFMYMTKEQFDTFNWDNLDYQPIYQQMEDNCDLFWVSGVLLQDVDTSKIHYRLHPDDVKE